MKSLNKKLKKAFTLVELVVVIAIIAILSTVSVVTYFGITNSAKASVDNTLITELNKCLQLDETLNGKPATPTDALAIVEENGYTVEKMTPTQDNKEIVWHQDTNKFELVEEIKASSRIKKAEGSSNISTWRFLSEYTANGGYSVYLKEGSKVTSLEITTGFDAGKNTGITTITYNGENHESLIIRTNSKDNTDITINSEVTNFYHYGDTASITLSNEAGNVNLVENGKTGSIIVNSGSVSVLDTAEVTNIMVPNSVTGNVNIVVPEASKTIVYAPENENVKVIGVKKNTATADADKIKTGSKYYSGGQGTEDDPFSIQKEEDALNIKNASGYYRLDADIKVSDEIYMSGKKFTIDLNGRRIELEYGDGVEPRNGSVFYIGGKNGNLTITDSSEKKTGTVLGSKITYPNKVTSAVRVGNYGKLTINGGNFVGQSEGTSCIFVYTTGVSSTKATVIINGGTFKTLSPNNGIYYVLNHQDSLTNGCTITVNGGKFYNYNPGVTVVDPTSSKTGKITLGTGCTTTESMEKDSHVYTVSKNN